MKKWTAVDAVGAHIVSLGGRNMGEVVEMMEEGILCQTCGVYLDKSKGEFFQNCPSCEENED